MDIFKQLRQAVNQVGELVTDEVRPHVELGTSLLEQGNFEGAMHELKKALSIRPDHARATYLLGLCYQRRNHEGDREKAKELFLASIAKHPEVSEPYLALGSLLEGEQKLEEALIFLQKGLSYAGQVKQRKHFQKSLGRIYLQQKQYSKAIRELRKATAEPFLDYDALPLLVRTLEEILPLKEPVSFVQDKFLLELKKKLLQAVKARPLEETQWFALGCLLRRLEDWEESGQAFLTAIEKNQEFGEAFLEYAKLLLERKDAQAALPYAQRAYRLLEYSFQERPGLFFSVTKALADSYLSLGQVKEALTAYGQAFDFSCAVLQKQYPFMQNALLAALYADEEETAQTWSRHPALAQTPLALAVRARAQGLSSSQAKDLLVQVDSSDALAYAERLLSEAILARSELASEASLAKSLKAEQQSFQKLLEAVAVSPLDPRPSKWLKEWCAENATNLPLDIKSLLEWSCRFFERTPEYQEASPRVKKIYERFCGPFSLVVMGEFSAGKSTLLNALLGEELLPTGITPTTSMVTQVTYGRDRSCALVYKTGEEKIIPWEKREELLQNVEPSELLEVKWVRITCPLDLLKDVSLIDTPGLNSFFAEHEIASTQFIQEADGLLWVFTAEQAGKATEKAILKNMGKFDSVSVVGILNKADRVKESTVGESIEMVIAHLRDKKQGLADLLVDIVPVSGKKALAGRQALGQTDAKALLEESNLPALEDVLQRRFFSQQQQIKTNIATEQMISLIRFLQSQAAVSSPENSNPHEPPPDAATSSRSLIEGERKKLIHEIGRLHEIWAKEMVEIARPRSWLLGDNDTAPADRDYLAKLIEEDIQGLLKRSQERIEEQLPYLDPSAREHARFLVYDPYLAFTRGFLQGGMLDHLFFQVLPKAELTESSLLSMIDREFPTALHLIESILLPSLENFISKQFQRDQRRQAGRAAQVYLQQEWVEARLQNPLHALEKALRDITV